MAGFGRLLAEGAKDFAAGVYKGLDGKATSKMTKKMVNRNSSQMMHMGNAFINSAPMTGIAGTARDFMTSEKGQRNILKSLQKGHMKGESINAGAVMGTMATVGVAGRAVTGGGLYRDRYGNVNIPGLPFI